MSSHVGDKLKLVRNALGLSQAKFCELLDIGIGGYKKYEIGLSEPGYSVIEKFANHGQTKMFIQWLLTDTTNPNAGQISPSDKMPLSVNSSSLEDQFVDAVSDSILMFGYFDWITINKDKIDLDACGKYVFQKVAPIIGATSSSPALDKTVNS